MAISSNNNENSSGSTAAETLLIPTKRTIPILTPTYQAILDSWGFKEVVAEFVWIKDKFGNGYRNRNQHEKCLLATKGNMPLPAKLFSSFIDAPRGEHSEKPLLHQMAEEMFPERNYCELFAREPEVIRPGWTYWGNEAFKNSGDEKQPVTPMTK